METEASPLLRNLSNISERKPFCRRIPKEIIVTATVLGLFLVSISLLIVIENAKSTPTDEITVDSNLLGSPMKYKKEFPKENDADSDLKKFIKKDLDKVKDWLQEWNETSDNDTKAKDEKFIHRKLYKMKTRFEEWKKSNNIDDYQDTLKSIVDAEKDVLDLFKKFRNASVRPLSENELLEILQDVYKSNSPEETKLLGSPFKFDKKALDTTWQDKKAKYVKTNKDYNKEILNKNGQAIPKFLSSGSPMKYEKEFPKENDAYSDLKKYIRKELDKVIRWLQGWSETSDIDTKADYENFIHSKLERIKTWVEEWKKSNNVDNYQDTLKSIIEAEKDFLDLLKKFQDASDSPLSENELEILQGAYKSTSPEETKLLGSPFKYNKKALDTTWQDKKAKYVKTVKDYNKEILNKYGQSIPKSRPSENLLKSSDNSADETINLLGSSFQYNKKDINKEWQNENDLNNKKWDSLNKGYKKIFPLGSSASNTNTLDKNWLSSGDDYMQYTSKKNGDNDKEFKKHDKSDDEILKEMEEFYDAWKNAEKRVKYEKSRDYEMRKKINRNCTHAFDGSVVAQTGCPFANLLQSSAVPQDQVNCAIIAEQVRRELGRCIDISFLPKECKPSWSTKCFSSYKYRTLDGTCNNQIHPTWGKSGTPFVRMVAPDYGDGVSSVRTSVDGSPLPNPRFLSQKLYSKKIQPDSDLTLLFITFGLIVDHDMIQTAVNTDGIPCCSEQFDMYPKSRPRECLQIDVPDTDPFYGPKNVKCLNFVRSVPVHGECGGRREQLNKATSFLDASTVYGSQIYKTKSLRSFNKGQLRTQRINNTPYMASSKTAGYSCGTPSEPLKCFEAGDSRVNMLVELTAMHTLWYREHNRIAEELSKINPQWVDETLFQEARRILIGELQHITFNEFLPLLLGKEAMDYFQLNIEKDEFYDGYDETIDPSVFNVVGAAAFRFGHSLLKDVIDLIGPNNKSEASVALHETYFNPSILYHKGLDSLLRGATKQKLNSVDSFISTEIRGHLFQPADKDYGHDLAAVGIQRGRDHGLPSYNKWRAVCGLPQMKSWDDLKSVMNVERAEKLKEVYKFVDDIDLIPGGLAEDHVEGSLLGPTYLCILGRQFTKTRKGDRFWFEMENSVGSFTKDQLNELYNSNMARIICDNSDKITENQKNVFKSSSATNPVVSCEDIPKVDLSKWYANY